jgi:predicted negative regulator of RcsB-dependent stress response
MPSHIYYRVGRYEDAVRSNQAAVKADETFFKKAGKGGIYPVVYFNHNIHFIWSAASMEGRSKVAIAAAKRLSSGIKPELVKALPIGELFVPVELEALVQFGQWNTILAKKAPPKEERFATALWHYAQGFAYAAKGQLNKAKADLAALEAAKGDPAFGPLKGFGVPADQLVEIAATLLAGEIARREDKLDDAIKLFEQAVALQAKVPYTEPAYWYYPTQHTLGAALMQAKRYAEAEKVYRDSLAEYRDDGWALFGLWRALDAQGKAAEAKSIKSQFVVTWANADVRLSSSRF